MEKSNVMGRIDQIKGEVINHLCKMNLVGKIVNTRDLVDSFLGYSLSGNVSGMSGFVIVTKHEGDLICLENDFGDDLGEEFSLEQFGLEFLTNLLD